ncbi:MAG: DNA repair protein RadC [Flavitalea sp.]
MQEQIYSIKTWAKTDRPREKLRSRGPENLTDTELLAILIHNGTRQRTAVDLAKEVLNLGKNDLGSLGRVSVRELMKIKGIGEAKAVTIAAALEIGRRRQAGPNSEKKVVKESRDIAFYLQALLRDHQHEVFGVIFLNRSNRINHYEIISEGGITGTVADPRIILKKALEEDAVNLILFHNHPSGNLKPSQSDKDLTTKIREAASYFDIRVLDHIIVSEEGYFSFADGGMI